MSHNVKKNSTSKSKFQIPYKIHFVQELSDDDFDRRIEFCD